MTMTKELSVLLIVICALGSCKTQAIPVDIRVAPYPLIVGQPSHIQLHLSRDPKVDQRDLHVWKRPNGTSEDEGKVPGKGDFICEGMYKSQTKNLDFRFPEGYACIWNSDKLILTIFIEEVGPQHEGAYVAEYGFTKFPFHRKVLAAPPSTQAPDTTTDGVKDSSAADAHREDCKDWKNTVWRLWAVIIILVIVLGLVILWGVCWIKRKRSAAFERKTDKEEESPFLSRGQDQTPGNASGTPLEDVDVHGNRNRRGQNQTPGDASETNLEVVAVHENRNHRPGSGHTRIADQTASTEGRAGSGAVQPDSENDNNVIANTPSTVPRGEVRRH